MTTKGKKTPGATCGSLGLSRRALKRVLSYMEDNMRRRLSLKELAGIAEVSRAHFARMFKVSVGVPPMQYLVQRRIEKAKRLILDGVAHPKRLAADLGFCDHSHFCRVFKRITGHSPRRFGHLFAED